MESQWDSKRSPISAKTLLLAEKYGKVGERYIIAKQFLTYQELFGLVAAKGGHKPPKQMPLSVAYAAAWIGEHLAKLLRRKDYLIRTDAVFLSVAFRELDSTKARRDLHWKPRPFAETVSDSIAWFAERKKVAPIGFPPIFGRW